MKSQYVKVLDELHAVYKNNGFCPVMTDWAISKDPVVKISYANPQDHVPRAERNNRVLPNEFCGNWLESRESDRRSRITTWYVRGAS